jgi:hypothetical protein
LFSIHHDTGKVGQIRLSSHRILISSASSVFSITLTGIAALLLNKPIVRDLWVTAQLHFSTALT